MNDIFVTKVYNFIKTVLEAHKFNTTTAVSYQVKIL